MTRHIREAGELRPRTHSTTILALKKDGDVVIAGDGQVTFDDTVMKHGASKVRYLYRESVLVGFAGAAADAFSLLERLEEKLEMYKGNLTRAAVELAKEWRTDKVLRRLEAMLLAADQDHILIISGTGDVIEPDEPVAAIGSGGPYALSAAKALIRHSDLTAAAVAEQAMKIAAEVCIYTNEHIVVHELKKETA